MPAHHLRRTVEIASIDQLQERFDDRIANGFTYDDFQYMTDESSTDFLRTGVLSCYRAVLGEDSGRIEPPQYLLARQDWLKLLHLSHSDKARAFEEYAGFYQRTDGQIYNSDSFQLSMYIDSYHLDLDRRLYAGAKCNETITELYVPPSNLADFMHAAAEELARRKADVIYGTIRLIERDDATFLNWARERYACVVFNLHFQHTEHGVAKVADDLRALIELATERVPFAFGVSRNVRMAN